MTIPEARETFRKAFEADPGFRQSYEANVAMLLHDRYLPEGPGSLPIANQAAIDILHLVFGK